MSLKKIVSGGETGVDRAALDAALAAQFDCGGWAPGDRMAEDGVIPDRYPLVALPEGGHRQRTRLNVVDSDGTALIYHETLIGGTRLTRNLCAFEKKPYVLLDARQLTSAEAVVALLIFIDEHGIGVLNVAGPRASGWPGAYAYARDVVGGVLEARSAARG